MTLPLKKNQFNPEDREQRCRRLYRKQQSGLTCRALVFEHVEAEGVSLATAWRDWDQVKAWNDEDFSSNREHLVARLNAMRFRAINMALKKGQLQSAAQMMDSLGKAVGEGAEFTTQEDVKLNISIEKQGEI